MKKGWLHESENEPEPSPRSDGAGRGRRLWRDRLAVTVSVACAFHCVATPLIILLLPGLRSVFPENPWFEITLLAFVLVLGGSSVLHGYRHHRRVLPPVLFAGAFLVLCVQAVLPERDGEWVVPSLTALGLVVSLLWSQVPERSRTFIVEE